MPWIMNYSRKSAGKSFDANYGDFVTAFNTTPSLLSTAQSQIDGLTALNNSLNGYLKERDNNQYAIYQALLGMMAEYQGAPPQ